MNRPLRTALPLLAVASLLAACATPNLFGSTPTGIYYKDGKPAYVASCSGSSWKSCLEQAGSTCLTAGYNVLEKNTNRSYGEETREMVFACNGNSAAVGGGEAKAGVGGGS